MLGSELRIEIIEAFNSMTLAISKLCDAATKESELVAWVQGSEFNHENSLYPLNARESTCQILKSLQYTQTQAPREILVCPGFIGASPHTLNLASEVNECKERFKKSVIALKTEKTTTLCPDLTEKMNSILSRNLNTATTLKSVGLARLHLKQCYRKIPILSHSPLKISWTWAHTRSIKKISINKAQEMLLKKGTDAGIEMQIDKLKHLGAFEELAIVQELAPHLRANIVYSIDDKIHRSMIKGPIPIFFPCTPETPFPQFKPPVKKCDKDQNRSKRSDVRLDPNPYLPAIRAHRYSHTG